MLKYMAYFDELTEIPNRRFFLLETDRLLIKVNNNNHKLVLMFIDGDNIKEVNDKYGHYYGDLLLKNMEKRLISTTGEKDIVARIGGDEFTIILQDFKRET